MLSSKIRYARTGLTDASDEKAGKRIIVVLVFHFWVSVAERSYYGQHAVDRAARSGLVPEAQIPRWNVQATTSLGQFAGSM